jgi:hypothetical protein
MDSKTEQAEQLQTRLLKLTIKGFALKKAIEGLKTDYFTRDSVFEDYFSEVSVSGGIRASLENAIENDLKTQLKEVRDELVKIKNASNQLIENELLNN